MAQDAGAPDSIVFRIRIDRMTGVAEGEMNGGISAILS
jgi:hypothetical protein